jgi:myosin heavy subunit
LFIK